MWVLIKPQRSKIKVFNITGPLSAPGTILILDGTLNLEGHKSYNYFTIAATLQKHRGTSTKTRIEDSAGTFLKN